MKGFNKALPALLAVLLLCTPAFSGAAAADAASEEKSALPFAEEKGLRFVDELEELPLIPNAAAIYKDTVIHSLTGTLGVPEVTVSEVGEDGCVTYTVRFAVNVDMDYSYPVEQNNALTVNFASYEPYDYYTGTFFDFEKLHTDGNETDEESSKQGKFVLDGVTVVFEGDHVLTAQWGEPKVTDSNGTRNVVWHLTALQEYTISVPADYDGLIFGAEYGKQSLSPEVTSAEGYQKSAVWEGDPEDWIFFRAPELAALQAGASDAA